MPKTRNQRILEKLSQYRGGKLWVFIVQQGWAALFGGLMLGGLILTHYVTLPWLPRYDWLFLWAITIQLFMLATKLEKPHEVLTILVFHLTGLLMELFKTSDGIGSWTYPGEAFFHLGNVPLFSGFMYAAVGSYIARAWRVMSLRYTHYPPRVLTAVLAVVIYLNFFTHHYIWDFRILLFLAVGALYGRTTVYFRPYNHEHKMPLLVGFLLITFFIWLAENIGTITKGWLYPSQLLGWQPVSLQKFGSWFLLMIISFVLVELLHHFRADIAAKHKAV